MVVNKRLLKWLSLFDALVLGKFFSPSGKILSRKAKVFVIAHSKDFVVLVHRFDRAAECDRRTDRQTDAVTFAIAITCLA